MEEEGDGYHKGLEGRPGARLAQDSGSREGRGALVRSVRQASAAGTEAAARGGQKTILTSKSPWRLERLRQWQQTQARGVTREIDEPRRPLR